MRSENAVTTMRNRLAVLPIFLLMFVLLIPGPSYAVLLQTESIVSNPSSAANLWKYSYKSGYSGISNAYSYATALSQYSDAAFQGYVTGLYNDYVPNYLHSLGATDYKTVHVLSTYLLSTADQTIDVRLGGDDGHSLFLNGSFVAGAGYGTSPIATISLLANTIYEFEFVGYNYTGPWGWAFGLWDTDNNQWAGAMHTSSDILINADGDFSAVPEPATMLLLGSGLIGLAGTRKKFNK